MASVPAISDTKPAKSPWINEDGSISLRFAAYTFLAMIGLILLVIFLRPHAAVSPTTSATQPFQMTIQPGESLTQKIGFQNAITVAENAGLPIQARLIGSSDLVTLKPADARKLAGTATDVVLVTVKVHPGDKLAMTLDDKKRIVPGSITYTAAR